jgi:hypothetical protein
MLRAFRRIALIGEDIQLIDSGMLPPTHRGEKKIRPSILSTNRPGGPDDSTDAFLWLAARPPWRSGRRLTSGLSH